MPRIMTCRRGLLMARLAVVVVGVVKGVDELPIAGDVTGRALPGVMVERRLLAVAGRAVGIAGMVKRYLGPIFGAAVAVSAFTGIMGGFGGCVLLVANDTGGFRLVCIGDFEPIFSLLVAVGT